METEGIVNRVAQSSLILLDLEDYLSTKERVDFDVKDLLFEGLILREKEFRAFVKNHDWSQYDDKLVRLHCSADAIVPTWAYMILVSKLQAASLLVYGSNLDMEHAIVSQAIEQLVATVSLEDAKVVVKGCGEIQDKEYAYTELAKALVPKVTVLMFGEPCSTVPVYKKSKK